MKNIINKIKEFVSSHKAVSITSASVAVLAIVAGVGVGIMMNKNNKIETKPKKETSSVSSTASSEEAVSSEEPVVSEEPVSSEAPVESQAPVSSAPAAPKQTTSQPKATTSNPQPGAVVIGGGTFANGTGTWLPSGWVCPDKSSHAGGCLNQAEHDAAVERQKKQDERNAQVSDQTKYEVANGICTRCHRKLVVWGVNDNEENICRSYFDTSKGCYVCGP